VVAVEVVLLSARHGAVIRSMAYIAVLGGLVPQLLLQVQQRRIAPWPLWYRSVIGAQLGLAGYFWLGMIVHRPLLLAIVLDQTVWSIPALVFYLVTTGWCEGRALKDCITRLEIGSFRSGLLWTALRINWIFWALFAKPLELVLGRSLATEQIVLVDGILQVLWYVILARISSRAMTVGSDGPLNIGSE
jgi:hypothetical protein